MDNIDSHCGLPISVEQEGDFCASKWQHLQVLASKEELQKLFHLLGDFRLFSLGTPLPSSDVVIPQEEFLALYGNMIEGLQKGETPTRAFLKKFLPCCLSSDRESLYLQQLSDGRCLVKMRKPVLQIQAHFFRYSPLDRSFRSMILGEGAIFWGLQFSYPQIFQDPETLEIQKQTLHEGPFALVRKWVRDETRATPFVLEDGLRVNVPIRLGRSCFAWIAKHPDLSKQRLSIEAHHED